MLPLPPIHPDLLYIQRMESELPDEAREPADGDWSLVDLSDELCEEATKVAHALGLDFDSFMKVALREKLDRMRESGKLPSIDGVQWGPLLKVALESAHEDSAQD